MTAMRALLVIALLCIGTFFGLPLLNEMEQHPCDARDKIAARTADTGYVGAGFGAFSPEGANRRTLFKGANRVPLGGLTCTTDYWKKLTRSHRLA